MNQEFSVSKGQKIFYCLLAAAMIGFAFFLFTIPTQANRAIFLLPLSILAGAVLIIAGTFKRAIIITDDSITNVNLFKTKTIYLTEIKGFRITDKLITIEGNEPAVKLSISNYSDYADNLLLKNWLKDKFTDLNKVEYQAQLADILADQNLGLTEEDRQQQLNKAKYTSLIYSIGGIAQLIAIFVHGNNLLTIVSLIYPLIGIIIIATSKGLIKFLTKKASPYYHIFLGFQMSATALLIPGISNHVLRLTNFWLPFMSVVITFGLLLYFVDGGKQFTSTGGLVFIILLVSGMYSTGAVLATNCNFDHSPESTYQPTVLDHRISRGKSTTYYLKLSPWGPKMYPDEVSVSRYKYEEALIGATVTIHLKQGLLHIPWYTVTNR